MSALICGSFAFDTIMVFHDQFKNHILPDKVHILNVSFLVPDMRREFGGCAGNIAYNLKLLGGDPLPMGTVGTDFATYAQWMDMHKIPRTHVKEVEGPIKYPCINIDSAHLIATFLDYPGRWAIISTSIIKSLEKYNQFEVHNLISPPPDRVCYMITHRFPKPGSVKCLEIMQNYLDEFLTDAESRGLLTKLS